MRLFQTIMFGLFFATSALAQSAPPQPPLPTVSRVNIFPSGPITAYVDDVVPLAIEVVTNSGARLSNFTNLPIKFITGGDASVDVACVREHGICALKARNLGVTQFSLSPIDGGLSYYNWVVINFIRRPAQSSPLFPVPFDNLVVTFSTNQGNIGETITGAVTFGKSYPGPVGLLANYPEGTKYFYFPDGVKAGDRQIVLEKKLGPLEDSFTQVNVYLEKLPSNQTIARGYGYLGPWKGFDIAASSTGLKITDPTGNKNLEYRVYLTQGQKFLLELPMRRFDLASGVELVFFDGMFGSTINLPFGRYTVTLIARDRNSGNEYQWSEHNGLVLNTGVTWR